VAEREGEKRKPGDRRVFREARATKPWWLMRRYVNVEKFLGDSAF
jgi:hypothetical protein